MPFTDMVANNYTMKIILPEGAVNIKVLYNLLSRPKSTYNLTV